MRKSVGIIFFLSAIILVSSTMEPIIADNLPFEQPISVGYSDKLVPGTELSWKVTKATGTLNETAVSNYTMVEGSTLKIKLLKDPDDVVQNNYDELFKTDEDWAEFYINDHLIGTDSTSFDDLIGGMDLTELPLLATFIFPTVFVYSDGNKSSFQVLYDAFSPMQTHMSTTTTGAKLTLDYSVSLNDKTFEVSLYVDTTFDFLGQTMTVKLDLNFMYDITYGIMILYHIKGETSTPTEKNNGELRIESTTPGAEKPPSEAPFELFYAILALMVLGAGILSIKKKRRHKYII